jgi:hypothetical protein
MARKTFAVHDFPFVFQTATPIARAPALTTSVLQTKTGPEFPRSFPAARRSWMSEFAWARPRIDRQRAAKALPTPNFIQPWAFTSVRSLEKNEGISKRE